MEVTDQHRVEALRETRLGDLPPQALGLERRLAARAARPRRDAARERNAEVGVEELIERDARRAAHHLLEQPVAEIAAHQPIAMMDPDAAPLELERQGVVDRPHPDLALQEASEPEVVVAVEVGDGHAGPYHPVERGQGAEGAGRNGIAVFEPEVEQVADNVEGGSAAGEAGKKVVKSGFTRGLPLRWVRAEMGIAHEICRPAGHARQSSRFALTSAGIAATDAARGAGPGGTPRAASAYNGSK